MSKISAETVSELRSLAKEYNDKAWTFERAADAMESIIQPNGFRVELTPSALPASVAKMPKDKTRTYEVFKLLKVNGSLNKHAIAKKLKLGKSHVGKILSIGKKDGYFKNNKRQWTAN